MDKFPLVTVNILTYNNFDFLKEALDSVYNQNYQNIEIIISDDGSVNYNKTYIDKLIRNKTENIKNIILIHHENNLGIVKNLNNCIKRSNGFYFIGLSSDDIFYDNNVISDVVDEFIKTKAKIVTSKRAEFINDITNISRILPYEEDIKYFENNRLFERLAFSNFISGSCTFHSKELFETEGLFDEKYNLLEDYPYYLKLARKNIPIHFYNRITIYYRKGGISNGGKINYKLKKDTQLNLENEILPYIKGTNRKLIKYKNFEHEIYDKKNKFNISIIKKYPLIYFLKILQKLKIFKIKPEFFIKK